MELTDPSQALHSLTSALAPTLAPTQDVFPGEELVSISGCNSTIGYLCGALTLHLSSGRVIECKGENAGVFGAPFTHHAAPSPGRHHELTLTSPSPSPSPDPKLSQVGTTSLPLKTVGAPACGLSPGRPSP